MRQLLLIAAVIVLVLLVRAWFRRPGRIRIRWIFYAVLTTFIVLAALGKLHWVAAAATAVAGVLPLLLKKAFLLLRYLPLLSVVINRAGYGKPHNSRFQTAWLRLEINPTLGTLDGEVLQGEFKGRRLSSLSIPDLTKLLTVLRGKDPRSAMLLQSYITFRQRRPHGASDDPAAHTRDTMTHEEALNILGLKKGATHGAVTRAHRRLMQKMHPDRGGSSYLAAKINQAKDTLLKP